MTLQSKCFQEIESWREDRELIDIVRQCIQAQRQQAAEKFESDFEPHATGSEVVSESALRELLREGQDVHGIATRREIANVIVFNARHIAGAVMSRQVATLRRQVDRLIRRKLRQHFQDKNLIIENSGHFWYPPGGYMSWHTNSGDPGWRMYVTYAEEPGKSFFRYRDPDTDEVITSYDHEWDFRLFRVSSDMPLWHTVYSGTHRFSLGFIIRPWSLTGFASLKMRRFGKALGILR